MKDVDPSIACEGRIRFFTGLSAMFVPYQSLAVQCISAIEAKKN